MFDASPKAVLPSPNASIPLVWVNKNQLYVLANGQMQTQLLPTELSFTTSQENLQKYQATISASLKISLFIVSLFFIALIMFFSFCLAFATGLVLKIIKNIPISYSLLAKWSFFLLGPLSVLWYLRLWVAIPLFSLAQLILCIIYMQQIFNLIPEVRPHAH